MTIARFFHLATLLLALVVTPVLAAFELADSGSAALELADSKSAAHPLTAHQPAAPSPQEPVGNWQEIKVRGFDKARRAADADLRRYKSFLVEQPQLEFDKHWLRDFKADMTDADEARIRETYTRALREALEKQLGGETGWRQVEQAAADTLVVAPRLTRFRITAPDLSFQPQTRDFVEYAGSARLTLALRDGASNAPVAELSDYSQTRSTVGVGDLKPTNRAENLHDFKMLCKRWAAHLGAYLQAGK